MKKSIVRRSITWLEKSHSDYHMTFQNSIRRRLSDNYSIYATKRDVRKKVLRYMRKCHHSSFN